MRERGLRDIMAQTFGHPGHAPKQIAVKDMTGINLISEADPVCHATAMMPLPLFIFRVQLKTIPLTGSEQQESDINSAAVSWLT